MTLLLADFAPALLLNVDAMLVGGFLDSPPSRVALIVADSFDLVEARDRVAHVARIVQRLLALLRKRELIVVEAVTLLFAEFGHGVSPSGQSTNRERDLSPVRRRDAPFHRVRDGSIPRAARG